MYTLTNIDQYHFPSAADSETYVLEAHRTASGLATVSSDQALSLFDPSRIGRGPLASLRTDHGNVTTLRAFDAATGVVCTAGEDGSVGVWDLRTGARVARFQGEFLSFVYSSRIWDWMKGT